MAKLRNFSDFLDEKKSPYKKATLMKYKRKWEDGEKIPFGIESSLKAQGLIPRADGEVRVSDEYKDTLKDAIIGKKKKVLKESFEDEMRDAEVTANYTDKNGKNIEVREIEGTGMAGEPMTFAYIFHDGVITSKEKVKSHMKPSDFKDLCDYLNDIADNNEASAISFVQ
jgi:hypothetical protein